MSNLDIYLDESRLSKNKEKLPQASFLAIALLKPSRSQHQHTGAYQYYF